MIDVPLPFRSSLEEIIEVSHKYFKDYADTVQKTAGVNLDDEIKEFAKSVFDNGFLCGAHACTLGGIEEIQKRAAIDAARKKSKYKS